MHTTVTKCTRRSARLGGEFRLFIDSCSIFVACFETVDVPCLKLDAMLDEMGLKPHPVYFYHQSVRDKVPLRGQVVSYN